MGSRAIPNSLEQYDSGQVLRVGRSIVLLFLIIIIFIFFLFFIIIIIIFFAVIALNCIE